MHNYFEKLVYQHKQQFKIDKSYESKYKDPIGLVLIILLYNCAYELHELYLALK